MDFEALLRRYIEDLNPAIQSRAFSELVGKWFAPDCQFSIYDETRGAENALRLWRHLLPKGGDVPRSVTQRIYGIEDGRVFSYRWLEGGNAPQPLWSLQETVFDERTRISQIEIHSQQSKPDLTPDEAAERTRLGRIFLAFADAFNEFFETGDESLLRDWLADDVELILESSFWGREGVVPPHHRIAQSTRFELRGVEATGENTAEADVAFENWGGLDGSTPWLVVVDPESSRFQQLQLTLKL